MKQIVPFTKDITFKTKIGDITGISLENDLMLKGEDLISGNFYIKGTYKMLKTSSLEEEYSYKIPCEIAISDTYDAFLATVDIDNFTYEVIDDEVLRVNIDVRIDNLEKKEIIKEPDFENIQVDELELVRNETTDEENRKPLEENVLVEEFKKEKKEKTEEKQENKEERELSVKDIVMNMSDNTKDETYKTYSVYVVREGDTIEKIANTYKVDITDIENYNDITNLDIGVKLVIPSSL